MDTVLATILGAASLWCLGIVVKSSRMTDRRLKLKLK